MSVVRRGRMPGCQVLTVLKLLMKKDLRLRRMATALHKSTAETDYFSDSIVIRLVPGDHVTNRLLLLILSVGTSGGFASSKVAPDVPASGQSIDVIIRFKNPPTKSDLKILGPYGQVK